MTRRSIRPPTSCRQHPRTRGDSGPPPQTRSSPTTPERADPLRARCALTQDHRRGTPGGRRRVCEHQQEQEAAREQGCAAAAVEVGTHGAGRTRLRVRVRSARPAPRPGAATRLTPPPTALPGGRANQGPAPASGPPIGSSPPGCPAPLGAGGRAAAGRRLAAPLTALRAERIDLFRLRASPPLAGDPAQRPPPPPTVPQVYAAPPSPPIPGACLPWNLERSWLSGDSRSSDRGSGHSPGEEKAPQCGGLRGSELTRTFAQPPHILLRFFTACPENTRVFQATLRPCPGNWRGREEAKSAVSFLSERYVLPFGGARSLESP